MINYRLPKLYDAGGDLSRQWYVHYSFKHPETGKFERFKVFISTRIKTRVDRYDKARQVKIELKKKLLAGHNPFVCEDKQSRSIAQALEYVSKYKLATLKKRSGSTYKSAIKIFLNWLEGNRLHNKPIGGMTSDIAERYMDDVMLDNALGNCTFNNRLGFMRTVFNLLVKKNYIDFNPFHKIDFLPEEEPAISAFTHDELNIIREHLPHYHYPLYVISQFIFYCFLRPQELVRLQFKDLFWEHQRIVIPGKKSKNGKTEMVVLPDRLIENLESWNRNWPGNYFLFSNNHQLTPGLKEIAPTRVAEVWRPFANKHGIEKDIYDLKHTGNGFATDLNLSTRDIQLQNRHHSLDVTQRYLDRFRREPGEKFLREFGGY